MLLPAPTLIDGKETVRAKQGCEADTTQFEYFGGEIGLPHYETLM